MVIQDSLYDILLKLFSKVEKENNVKFDLGIILAKNDDLVSYERQKYTMVEQNIIPTLLSDISGKYEPVKNSKIGELSVQASFYIPVNVELNGSVLTNDNLNTYYERTQIAIQQLQDMLIGYSYKDTNKEYSYAFNTSFLQDGGNVQENGIIYQNYYFTIFASFTSLEATNGNQYYFGNNVKYSVSLDNITYEEIEIPQRSTFRSNVLEGTQIIGEQSQKNYVQYSGIQKTLSFYFNKNSAISVYLYKYAEDTTLPQKCSLWLKKSLTDLNDNLEEEDLISITNKYVVESVSIGEDIGSLMTITLQLKVGV